MEPVLVIAIDDISKPVTENHSAQNKSTTSRQGYIILLHNAPILFLFAKFLPSRDIAVLSTIDRGSSKNFRALNSLSRKFWKEMIQRDFPKGLKLHNVHEAREKWLLKHKRIIEDRKQRNLIITKEFSNSTRRANIIELLTLISTIGIIFMMIYLPDSRRSSGTNSTMNNTIGNLTGQINFRPV